MTLPLTAKRFGPSGVATLRRDSGASVDAVRQVGGKEALGNELPQAQVVAADAALCGALRSGTMAWCSPGSFT
jgi:hypothetical protein